ncbi:MAG TPA: hypothetical protein VH643_04545, partial [Gemmataceae bacterium]
KRAAVALKRMGAKAKSAVPALEEALADTDAEVRAAVAAALEAIDPTTHRAEEKPVSPPPAKPKATEEPVKSPPPPRSSKPGEVGGYFLGPRSSPSILMQRKNDRDAWHRLKANDRVSANDRLVSLPSYASEVHLDSGVRLLLRGHVREFSLFSDMDYLQESAVVLHKSKDVDADLTLQTGRLYLSNHKKDGPAVVRLRFEKGLLRAQPGKTDSQPAPKADEEQNRPATSGQDDSKEVWDVTLSEPDTEVVVDLLKRYSGNVDYMKGEAPVVTLHLFVLKGKAGLAAEYQHYPDLSAPPGQAYFVWDNKRGGLRGPFKQAQVPSFFAKVLPVDAKKQPYAEKMEQALTSLSRQMLPSTEPTTVLKQVLQKTDFMQHQLAIYCLGAMDEVEELLEVLGDTDPVHAPDRDTAIFTLRRWLGRDAGNGAKLFDPKESKAGPLLSQQKYTKDEAERIFVLLHDFSEDEILAVETYEYLARDLISNKVAIAELARWHLYRLARLQGVSLPGLEPNKFNAAFPSDVRAVAFQEVRNKIEKGELPVRAPLPGKNGAPGAGKEPGRGAPKGRDRNP